MTQAAALIEALKRTLKARKMTYGQVAKGLRMSEASVKRMFSRTHFTLERLDRICELASTSLERACARGRQRRQPRRAAHAPTRRRRSCATASCSWSPCAS